MRIFRASWLLQARIRGHLLRRVPSQRDQEVAEPKRTLPKTCRGTSRRRSQVSCQGISQSLAGLSLGVLAGGPKLTVRAHYHMIKALQAAVQEQTHLGDQDGYGRASLRRKRAACPEEHNTDHREVSAGKPVHPTAPSEPRDTREGLSRRVEERA